MWFWHFFIHWTGSDYGFRYGKFVPYDFWSGIAGSFAVGAVVFTATWYRHRNCHVRWCLRLGRHQLTDNATGTAYSLCRRHHPAVPSGGLTACAAAAIHARNLAGASERGDR